MKDFSLTKNDCDLIIEGVENLKRKDFPDMMFDTLAEVIFKPKEEVSEEIKSKWEEDKKLRLMEKQLKEDKQKEFLKEVEILKSKLILMREAKEI